MGSLAHRRQRRQQRHANITLFMYQSIVHYLFFALSIEL
jgi:hypothetical protein